jgi:hypothetical protein
VGVAVILVGVADGDLDGREGRIGAWRILLATLDMVDAAAQVRRAEHVEKGAPDGGDAPRLALHGHIGSGVALDAGVDADDLAVDFVEPQAA